jgi:uncharacterized membrane protein
LGISIHGVGLVTLTLILAVAGWNYPKANPVTALKISALSCLGLIAWAVLLRDVELVEYLLLRHPHRSTAYLLASYALALSSIFLLAVKPRRP